MDRPPLSTGSINAHDVELYTSTLIILGIMLGPFQRTSDLVNRRDRENLIVEEAALSPLGQVVAPKRIPEPVFVPRAQIHMIAAMPTPDNVNDPHLSGPLNSGSLHSGALEPSQLPPTGPLTSRIHGTPAGTQRQFLVARIPKSCYVFTSTFVVSGICHLLEGSTIEQLLDAQDPFFPITQAVIYLHSNPSQAWRRDIILMNKGLIQAVYTAEARPAQPNPAPQDASRT